MSDGVVTYEIYPEAINQTRYCANQYKDVIENDWNEEVEDFYDCGGSYVNMPIGASEASIENVISLYMSGDVERAQREVALQLRELDCRGDEYPDYNNVIVDSCMIPRINGDGYSYETKTDDITGIESLSYYSLALSSESKKLLEGDIRRGVDAIKESLTSSTDKLITHFSDILSLISLDSLTEKQKELVQDRIDDWESELASNGLLGVSEGDVDNLITSIRRGMWASGTLFFSGISDSLDNKLLVQKLTQVYSVETSYSTILSYDYINLMNAVEWNDNGFVGNVFNGDIGHGLIIPRLGLYLDNMNCWEEQADCETPSLNPFTELSERGVAIMDHALIGIVVTKSVRGVMQYVAQKKLEYAGYDVAQAKKTRMGKYMLFDTFEEIYILYMFIALVLVVILPGMPLLKLSIMLMSWIYDVVKELVVLTLNIVLSPHSHIDEGFISDEVKESFQKILGLGLYFFFIVIGVIVMFIMFSFLYSLNVLVVGALNFIIDWSITVSSLEGMVMGIIMDTVIAALLVYEVRICTPYIDKLPQEMATYFNLNTSDTDGMVKHMERLLTSNVFMKVSGLLHK